MINKWTPAEILLLKEKYNRLSNNNLVALFPKRSFLSIYKKARSMGLKKDKDVEKINRAEARTKGKKKCIVTAKGYRRVYQPNHSRADKKGYVFEHIVVWEQHNGRIVPDGYVIHHINGNKCDNRIENLQLLSCGEHSKLHNSKRKISEKTKQKMSQKAKERLNNPQNHPLYKNIDIVELKKEVAGGRTVRVVCEKYGINKTTYYRKLKQEV